MAETEYKYYFNQDFIEYNDNEVFVDVGAENGNTVIPFIEHLYQKNLKPKHIYAFEPDPDTFRFLKQNVGGVEYVSVENSGVGSKNGELRFRKSSMFGAYRYCGHISPDGDISVNIHTIDSYFIDTPVSFLKFDPSGDAIIAGLEGASGIISQRKPKIIAGAYHQIENLYRIPKMLLELDSNYRVYLRHLAFHANETHAFAIPA
nr:FkbM family methyltransferase [Rhodocyclus gracilis]